MSPTDVIIYPANTYDLHATRRNQTIPSLTTFYENDWNQEIKYNLFVQLTLQCFFCIMIIPSKRLPVFGPKYSINVSNWVPKRSLPLTCSSFLMTFSENSFCLNQSATSLADDLSSMYTSGSCLMFISSRFFLRAKISWSSLFNSSCDKFLLSGVKRFVGLCGWPLLSGRNLYC